jgi:hypothetical protein
VKNPSDLLRDVNRRLERTWATDLTGATSSWPHRFPLGTASKTELESGWATIYQPLIRQWRDWATQHPVRLHTEPKRVYTTTQDLPSHLEVDSTDTAAVLVGNGWPERLRQARERLVRLTERFPDTPDLEQTLRTIGSYTESEFDLLLLAATWFDTHDATGLTPRQVPIPGLHAKWLNTHQPLILALTRRTELGLLPRHPARIHYTYLDPHYLATGARRHDSATVGDTATPAYLPRIVVISENKDTALHFPPIPEAIAVEGEGFGGKTAAAFPWLAQAPLLIYWGDIDRHGYEILNGWREDGIQATSILMDADTYDTYEPYGTNVDRKGTPLHPGDPKLLPDLAPHELAVYHRLLDPGLHTHRRIEQERIPLDIAAACVRTLGGAVRQPRQGSGPPESVSGSYLTLT